MPRPSAGPVSFAAAKPFFLLSLGVLAVAALVVKLVEEIRHPAVRMNYDPGNDAASAQSTGSEIVPGPPVERKID